jgi:hypothetical protein
LSPIAEFINGQCHQSAGSSAKCDLKPWFLLIARASAVGLKQREDVFHTPDKHPKSGHNHLPLVQQRLGIFADAIARLKTSQPVRLTWLLGFAGRIESR